VAVVGRRRPADPVGKVKFRYSIIIMVIFVTYNGTARPNIVGVCESSSISS